MTIVLNGTTGITNDGGYTGDGIVFADTTPANTLVTTTGGNVGIGTSSPTAKVSIDKSSDSASPSRTPADYSIRLTAAQTNTYNNGICVSEGSFANAAISPIDTGTGGAQGWAFITGDNSAIAERARIDSSGNLLVGTTSTDTTAVGIRLMNNNQLQTSKSGDWSFRMGRRDSTGIITEVYYNSSRVGDIATNGSNTTYNSASDYRLKENVQPIVGALDKVEALKPVTFTWKSTGTNDDGFLAHELQSVVPQAVRGEKDEVDAEGNPVYQSIDTSVLVATLTAAIQELKAIVDAQGAEITALKGTQS
jgi:hypothetical protein